MGYCTVIKQSNFLVSIFSVIIFLGISNALYSQIAPGYGKGAGDDNTNDSLQSEGTFNDNNLTNIESSNKTNATILGPNITESLVGNDQQNNNGNPPMDLSQSMSQSGSNDVQTSTEQNSQDKSNQNQPVQSLTQDQNLAELNPAEQNSTEPLTNLTDTKSTNLTENENISNGTGAEMVETNDLQPLISKINESNITAIEVQQQPLPNENPNVRENLTNVTRPSEPLQPQPSTIENNATTTIPLPELINITTPGTPEVNLLARTNTTQDEPLAPETQTSENITQTESTSNAIVESEATSDTLGQIPASEDVLGNKTSEEIDTASSDIAGTSNVNSTTENNQVSNIQNVINTIAIGAAQSGGNAQQAASQITKDVIANPKGPVAKAIQTLASEYSKGNSDEVNIAAKQIGTLVAKGNNIKQTLIQVTNNVVNNIQNIKNSIENYDKIIVNPKTSSKDKTIISETINVIKKAKKVVDVPQVHIKFHTHERNLVLRVLTTTNYKYDLPFSKYNGAFVLDDNEFRVKILSGDGKTLSASVAKMFKGGKVGDRIFLDKDIRKGKVFFSVGDINKGTYLLEVYIKLSNGAIGTFARGSVSIT